MANEHEHCVAQAYEDSVPKVLDKLRFHIFLCTDGKDFCGCETCRMDVLVYSLNRLPPRYVVGREGSAVTDVSLDKDQNRAAIEVAIMEGIRKVNLAPRCERRMAR